VGKLLVMCEYSGKIEGQNAKIDLPIAGGSCFAIRSDGYLLTNYHVVNLSRDPEDTLKEFGYPDMGRDRVFFVACFGPDSVDHIEVSLYAHSDRIDLAILKAPRTFTHPLSLSGEHIHQGDEVFAAGFPGSVDDFLRKMNPMSVSKDKIVLRTVQTGRYDGTELFDKDSFLPQLNRGIVSAVRRTVDNTACVEFDAGISHGNSGGPLLDGKNNVLGMVTYGLGDAGTPTDNFAISAEELRTELDRLVEPVNSNPPVRPVR
jgi:S1-C subfamily serine protease